MSWDALQADNPCGLPELQIGPDSIHITGYVSETSQDSRTPGKC